MKNFLVILAAFFLVALPIQVVQAGDDVPLSPDFETQFETDHDDAELDIVDGTTEDTSLPDASVGTNPSTDTSADAADQTQPEGDQNEEFTELAQEVQSGVNHEEPNLTPNVDDAESEGQDSGATADQIEDGTAIDQEAPTEVSDSDPSSSEEDPESESKTSGQGESEEIDAETTIEIETLSSEQCGQSDSSVDENLVDNGDGECATSEETTVLDLVDLQGEQTEVEEPETPPTESTANAPGEIAPIAPDPYFHISGVQYSYLPTGGNCSGKTNCTVSATPIQDALNFAKGKSLDDDTIYFESGTYSENFTIDGFTSELILRPEDTATASFSGAISILNNSVPITIRDFTFNNGSTVTINNSTDVNLAGTGNADYFDIYTTGSAEINLEVGGSDGTDELTINGTSGSDTIKFQSQFIVNGNQTIEYKAVEDLVVNGGGGNDTLTGPDVETSFDISGANSGTFTTIDDSVTFSAIESLSGASKADAFIFQTGGSLSGSVDGGTGIDTLNYSNLASGVTVSLAAGTAPGVSGLSNMEKIIGTSLADSLTGDANDNIFLGNGGADTIVANDGSDTITVTLSGASALAVSVNGGNGTDSLTVAGTSGVDSFVVDIANSQVTRSGTQIVTYSNFGNDGEQITVDGLGGADTLSAATTATYFVVNDENAGNVVYEVTLGSFDISTDIPHMHFLQIFGADGAFP